MKANKEFNPISIFDFEDEHIKFNHKEISIKDSVFLCYHLVQKGDLKLAARLIDSITRSIQNSSSTYMEEILWLWISGEYFNKANNVEIPEKTKNLMLKVINNVELYWQKPAVNWIGETQEGIFLTNLAVAYGALQSVNNFLKNDTAQQCMLKIKDFMFKKFLKEGKVLSKLGSEEIMGDICLISVPFGLMDAGNQILVETIKVVERELVSKGVRLSKNDTYYGGCIRNDLTCLLSWYYSERGDIARAKWLLEQVEAVWNRDGKLFELDLRSYKEELYFSYWSEMQDNKCLEKPFTYIAYAIAQQNIKLKEQQGVDAGTDIQIIHNPLGTENKYIFSVIERFPRQPEEGENVILKAVTQPFDEEQVVNAIYTVNGITQQKSRMRIKTSSEGEKYWETEIGSFNYCDRITYYFEVSDRQRTIKSNEYGFTVRKWHTLSKVTGIVEGENELSVYFENIDNNQHIPCLKIKQVNDNTLKWSFCFEDQISVKNILNHLNQSTNALNIDNTLDIDFGNNKLNFNNNKISFSINDLNNNTILKSYRKNKRPGFIDILTDGSSQAFKVRFNLNMASDERIFGLGERYSHIQYRGLEVDNYVYNQYRDQGLRTYMPVPFLLSSKGYGIYLDTPLYARYRFGTRLSDLMELEVDLSSKNQTLDMYLYTGNPKEVLGSYTDTIGKAKLPPKWVFGPWISSNNWDKQEEVMKQIALGKKYEIPSTVIVLEQWSDEATFYIFNDAQYEVKDGNSYFELEDFTFPAWGRWPDPKKMVKDIHDEGLKILLWQAPVMKYMDGIAHAQRDEDEKVMLKNGFCVKHKDGEPYRIPSFEWFKRSLVPDFTNPAAKEWWLNKRKYLLEDLKIDGFKTDGGECIYGSDLLFHDGSTGSEMRNLYPNLYVGSYQEFIKKYKGEDGITFSRAGYTGAQKIPLHWAGDERSTYKAFAASVKAGLSCSMSGIPFWGWDLGGFNGDIPTAELYVRSAQMAAFCPIMQYHAETKGQFNQDRTPWNIAERTGDERVIQIYKKYADLRMNLLPYIYMQAVNTCKTGIPMMRLMHLEYPEDPSCIDLWQQYLFGDSLLVAPVIEEGSTVKDVYLPEGKWLNLFSGEIFEGPLDTRVKANLDEIPVFVKENSVIPLNLGSNFSLFEYVSNKLDTYNNLCFMLFVTSIADCNYIDDLGNKVSINVQRKDENILAEIESNYSPITLIFRGINEKISIQSDKKNIIKVNSVKEIISDSYTLDNNSLIIKLDCEKSKQYININFL
ncbi:MAG TPA: hypothetical protein GXX36_05945 [Clostridiaceae bacterium]|nr:hypothetical protein [Clostridiaceae bacterium]HHV99101.1 hypothetical protein [Clostridiaceae bacterium]